MIDPTVRSPFNYPTDLIYLNTGTLGLCPKSAIDAIKAAIDEGEEQPKIPAPWLAMYPRMPLGDGITQRSAF